MERVRSREAKIGSKGIDRQGIRKGGYFIGKEVGDLREIKFRGKRIDNGEWVYGGYSFCEKDNTHWITVMGLDHISHIGWHQEVVPETVGQFIGIKDRSGTDIFEGDIVQLFCPWFQQSKSVLGVVFYNKTEFLIKGRGFTRDLSGIEIDDGWAGGSIEVEYKVVGNIYDNAGLIPKEIEL